MKFEQLKRALRYIDDHLDEPLSLEAVAERFYFSPYYFHRVFSSVVGKTLAAHIRGRRLEKAGMLLADTPDSVLSIALECGFDSSQSFSRAFKSTYGLPPAEYRRLGYRPAPTSVGDMIVQFTNRLQGGMFVNPNLIKRDALLIAGVAGDGDRTGEVWAEFMRLQQSVGLAGKVSDAGYEVRVYDGERCTIHVGLAVADAAVDGAYSVLALPPSSYASFDVYVSRGYESENGAMEEWLRSNGQRYSQRMLDGKSYAVEYYDERFHGDAEDSIVEIWVPVVRRPSGECGGDR